jgi:hypothetical protein
MPVRVKIEPWSAPSNVEPEGLVEALGMFQVRNRENKAID